CDGFPRLTLQIRRKTNSDYWLLERSVSWFAMEASFVSWWGLSPNAWHSSSVQPASSSGQILSHRIVGRVRNPLPLLLFLNAWVLMYCPALGTIGNSPAPISRDG